VTLILDAGGLSALAGQRARLAELRLRGGWPALDDGMPLMDYLDSLLAVDISSWIERELGVKVTIMELMKGPTIAQLAATLLTRAGENATAQIQSR